VKETNPPEHKGLDASGVERATGAFERILAAGDVAKVYGKPIQKGEMTIIPAAEILAIGGFGAGAGSGADPRRGGGGGGGGGGRVLARSVAVIVATPDGAVRVQPVIDVTKIALAALTAAGFVIATWSGMTRPKKFLRL
jgi:uncharacterized spore protein YtfJ